MIAVWILLGLIALITLLLMLPVRVFVVYSPERGLVYYAKYLFLKIEAAEEPNEKLIQQIFSILGLSDVRNLTAVRRAVDIKGVSTTFGELFSVIRMLLGRVGWLLKRSCFHHFDLRIVAGDSDCADVALGYGTICAVVFPLVGLLERAVRFRRKNVAVLCDYNAETTSVTLDLQLNVRLGLVLRALLHVIRENVKRTLEREGDRT